MMSMKGVGFFVVCLVLCALRVGGAVREDVESSDEVLLRRLVDPGNGGVDEYTAELIWYQCRRYLIYEEFIGGVDMFLSDKIFSHPEEINSECCISAKDIIQRIFLSPYPQLKRSLLNCLRENNLLLLVSGEDGGSKSWYTGYLKYIVPGLGWNLRRELLAETTLAPSLAPAPGPSRGSPQSSPAPSPDFSPQLATSPPPSVPPPFFPVFIHSPPPQGVNHSESTDTGSNGEGKGKNSNSRTVITAIVVTAAVTLIIASLIFLCWSKIRKARYGDRRNDERPLLSLSLNDYSIGSSHKPFASGNSVKEDMLAHQTYDTSTLQNGKSSQDGLYTFQDASKYSSASFGLSDNNNISLSASVLKPTSGLPPLKPPPGRISALPPEPPASLKPPSFKGNSPMPPPVPPPVRPPHTEGGPPLPGPSPAPLMASGARPPPPPPVPSGTKPGPPPPPKSGVPPPRPPPPAKAPRPPPIGGTNQSSTSNGQGNDFGSEAEAPKPKLKPFFWDKVQANPDHSMVWNQIKSGSFQFNEEEIETLFGYGSAEKKNESKNDSSQEAPKFIQIIDSKKAQNLSILLRALNVTLEEVCDALHEGNELPVEFLQTVLKMAPTADEELKLRLFSGELSQLGPADRFLKAMADIPFAFKRFEALFFISTLQEDVNIMKESFATLEVACKELKNSRLFLKLLEAVLKTGNRMNDGTFRGGALAFKLDTLLKLSDVKGVDGKTTLLHFVVQEIIRSEGMRAARAARDSQNSSGIKSDDIPEVTSSDTEEHFRRLGLQVVSNLGSELENVKRAAVLDADSLTGTVVKLGTQLVKTRNFLNTEIKTSEEENGFSRALKHFIQNAENDVKWLQGEEKRIMALVKRTGDYFHGKAGKDEGLRLFVIVRDFLIMLDKACKEVRLMEARRPRSAQKKESTVSSSSPCEPRQPPSPDLHRRLFPAIADRRISYSSSDDEDT